MALSKPTVGSNADYVARIAALFDKWNDGNYEFPATQVPSADANTLDDYEEGTWTPSVGGTATYTVQSGRYTKIGRAYLINGYLIINVLGTGSINTVTGIPFTSGLSVSAACMVGYWASSATSYASLSAALSASATSLQILGVAAGGATGISVATFFQNGAEISFSTIGVV